MIRLPAKVTQAAGKLLFKTAQRKPELCLVGGILLGGTMVVFAITDTWKNKETLQEDFNAVKAIKALPEADDYKVKLQLANKKLYFDILKTYWKSMALGGGSLILLVGGQRMLRKQLVQLGTAYAALMESYKKYRENVVKEFGAEKDQEFMYGLEKVEAIDAETGETVTKYVNNKTNMHSRFARWYDEGVWDDENDRWVWKNPLYSGNKNSLAATLHNIQNTCNSRLTLKGWMTLNEVYNELGLPPTEDGQHFGWVKGGFMDGAAGDDFIDFGVFPDYANGALQLPVNKAFLDLNSNQRIPLLEFNVICLDAIWRDIFEYDNRSYTAYEERKALPESDPRKRMARSKEHLDRWFIHEENWEK